VSKRFITEVLVGVGQELRGSERPGQEATLVDVRIPPAASGDSERSNNVASCKPGRKLEVRRQDRRFEKAGIIAPRCRKGFGRFRIGSAWGRK
jgi:hypothetical protein